MDISWRNYMGKIDKFQLKIEEIDTEKLNYRYLDPSITKCEMTEAETKFLIHQLVQNKPKKILEIGVAAGGTTQYILNNMPEDARLFSVDISKNYYREKDKESGYIVKELCNDDIQKKWTTYLGYDIIDCIDDIGGDIDFVVIDTVHAMPGEYLSYLVVLPYLKKNAVVILHDIHINYAYIGGSHTDLNKESIKIKSWQKNSYCTTLLFSTISSNHKIILRDGISNIGGFYIDDSTRENVFDVFQSLFAAWDYYPDLNMTKYQEHINQNYPEKCGIYFKSCLQMQEAYIRYDERKLDKKLRKTAGKILRKLHIIK